MSKQNRIINYDILFTKSPISLLRFAKGLIYRLLKINHKFKSIYIYNARFYSYDFYSGDMSYYSYGDYQTLTNPFCRCLTSLNIERVQLNALMGKVKTIEETGDYQDLFTIINILNSIIALQGVRKQYYTFNQINFLDGYVDEFEFPNIPELNDNNLDAYIVIKSPDKSR